MKITQIQTFVVGLTHRNFLFVKVSTDEGITGIGEAYSVGPDDAVANVVSDFETWLVGRDPRDVEALWHLMYAGSRFPGGSILNAALSGIEHALWDISARALGVPVYRLLGGKFRDRIRVYQAPRGATPEALAEDAVRLVERYGYTALKIGPQPPGWEKMPFETVVRHSAARLEAVRKAVGDEVDIGVDAHARIFEPARALEMAKALEPYRPFFFEEPLRPENIDALADLRARSPIPIATGEMLYTKFQFRELLEKRAADIIQPDICVAGGILECKKIAALAEANYVTVAPHNPMGPLATAVNVHFSASTPNFLILEYTPDDTGDRRNLLREPLVVKDGYLEVPEGPGFGVALNEEFVANRPGARWHRPFPILPDNSLGFQ
ncbi:MAG: galactonate dehydratase [Chloroflexi bacterium]|nr:galactonate dehydratase [Chloroflexota bacterium]